MVRQAQRGTEQGKVFSDNIDRLNMVGRRDLQRMLDERDWTTLPKLSHRPRIDTRSSSTSIADEQPTDTTSQRDDAPTMEEDIMLMVDNWLQGQSSK
jgi:transcriptional regulator with AAA-type ATPase domain